MKMPLKSITDVDDYIADQARPTQKLLKQIRAAIRKVAPDAEEVLSYHVPAYKYHGMLTYFAAHTYHVGLYPMPSAIVQFKKELSSYKTARGSIPFPLDQPLPLQLIEKMIRFRVKENLEKVELKRKK
jgi:uncharacterized protein YdhG (YjbR/CyaY superfamily)